MKYYIGIDLGGTNIVAGVVDENCRIVASAKTKTKTPRPAKEIVEDMAKVSFEAVAAAGLTMADIESVGVGAPGTANVETGVVEYSNNLGFEQLPLCKMMTELTGRKTLLGNDANVAALGEFVAGSGKGCKNLVAITLGTGVGGGIIIDGKIYCGSNYAGAELGHTVIVKDGRPCTCGRKGCFEAYASATGLINMTKEKMLEKKESGLWKFAESLEAVNGRTAFDAKRAGDPDGQAVVEEYIAYLACGITDIINIFQPDVLCIGGGICKEGDYLLKPLIAQVEKERYSKFCKKQTKIVRAALGNDAGVIGAAMLEKAQ